MTNIQWTNDTWNPLAGCSKVSAGCAGCYAIKDAHRLAGNPNEKIAAKYAGTTKNENGKLNWTGKINLAREEVITQPIRWTRPRRIFVNSMSDLFHESVPVEWIVKILAVIALSPHHVHQVLTKRPELAKWIFNRSIFAQLVWKEADRIACDMNLGEGHPSNSYLNAGKAGAAWPLPNLHLGVSVEDQPSADERLPYLLQTPAAVRFVSYEPALGPVDFEICNAIPVKEIGGVEKQTFIDWVIVGGESGPNARPCNIEWIRNIVRQCKDAGVPVFVKQLGANFQDAVNGICGHSTKFPDEAGEPFYRLKNKKGGDMSEWPEHLRVREYPK